MDNNPEDRIVFFPLQETSVFSSNWVFFGETYMLVCSMLDTQTKIHVLPSLLWLQRRHKTSYSYFSKFFTAPLPHLNSLPESLSLEKTRVPALYCLKANAPKSSSLRCLSYSPSRFRESGIRTRPWPGGPLLHVTSPTARSLPSAASPPGRLRHARRTFE